VVMLLSWLSLSLTFASSICRQLSTN
jgi:hypothetical protein